MKVNLLASSISFVNLVAIGVGSLTTIAPITASAAALEEVMVTARKREESLQETPLSVVSFSGDALEQQNVTNITDIAMKLPNVDISGAGGTGGTNASFYIRGLGATRNAVTQEAAVALYVDDEYLGRSDGALLSVLDVERIEVLRGPQGTLFGRNTPGGAIRYITAKPGDEFEAKIKASLGSFSRADVQAIVNVPLSDTAAMKITAASLNKDGYVKNVAGGPDTGDINTDLLRAQFRMDISDSLEWLVTGDYSSMDTNGAASVVTSLVATARTTAEADAVGIDLADMPVGRYDRTAATADNFVDAENYGVSSTLNWLINEDLSMKATGSYRNIDIHSGYDLDGLPLSLFEQVAQRNVEALTLEVQLNGSSDKLDWVTGVFYYDEEAADDRPVGRTLNTAPARSSNRIVDPIETETYAVFAQGTYNLTDKFSTTVGLRYTYDEKSIFAAEETLDGEPFFGDVESSQATVSDNWSSVTGRVSAEYRLLDDVFLFASYARGYRAGNFNDRILAGEENNGIVAYDEEFVDTYELGFRSELLDHRLRLNITAFYSDYEDLQLTSPIATSRGVITLIDNIGAAEIRGVEGEVIFALNDYVTIDGGFGLLDFDYVEVPDGAVVTEDSNSARAPDFSYNVGVSVDFPIESGELFARLDYGWKDDYKLIEDEGLNRTQEAFGLLSANLTYMPTEEWKLSVFGTNLQDEEYASSGIGLDHTGNGFNQVEPGKPRELGVSVEYIWR